MNKKTVTGRRPSQPELLNIKPEQPSDMSKALYEHNPAARAEMEKRNQERIDFVNSDAAEQFFIDVLSGKRAPVAKGRFSAKSGQMQNIPRSELVNMDYAVIEQRVTAMHPALAAPYGQTKKDSTDE